MYSQLSENELLHAFLHSLGCITIHGEAATLTRTNARTHTDMQIQPTGLNINTERKQIEAPSPLFVVAVCVCVCVSGNERLFRSNQNNWVILDRPQFSNSAVLH